MEDSMMDENALAAREQAVFAKLGRYTLVIDEQAQALQNSSKTIELFQQFLEAKGLKEEFVEFAQNPGPEAKNGKSSKSDSKNVEKQAKTK
jgi:hypothetical protein